MVISKRASLYFAVLVLFLALVRDFGAQTIARPVDILAGPSAVMPVLPALAPQAAFNASASIPAALPSAAPAAVPSERVLLQPIAAAGGPVLASFAAPAAEPDSLAAQRNLSELYGEDPAAAAPVLPLGDERSTFVPYERLKTFQRERPEVIRAAQSIEGVAKISIGGAGSDLEPSAWSWLVVLDGSIPEAAVRHRIEALSPSLPGPKHYVLSTRVMNAFVKDHDAAARTVMLIPGVRGIEVFSRGLEIFWRIILNGEASQEQVMSEVNAATPRLPGRVVYEVRAAARF